MQILTNNGEIKLPAFMPDATYGSIKAISFTDAKKAGVEEIVTTTLHIEREIGSEFIKDFGGIHKFFGWDRPILTDSGGWQVFSLINSKRDVATKSFATEAGCSFFDQEKNETILISPESSLNIQFNLGSDITTVLDYPILGNDTFAKRKECVRINTLWAKRSKAKYLELIKTTGKKPLIGAVIQGGNDFELRKQSAEELLELDFDLYNFGGMPLHTPITWQKESPEGFYHDMLEYVCNLIPNDKIKYAMGVGQPTDIAFCVDIGWHLFDTVLPTRNARHGYIYVGEGEGEEQVSTKYNVQSENQAVILRSTESGVSKDRHPNKREYKGTKLLKGKRFSYDVLHIKSERYLKDDRPLDSTCSCEACMHYSRAYIRHLIRLKEPAGFRLATIHNLHFYSEFMKKLRN